MARCPDCSKFVPYGEAEVEVESEEISERTVTVAVRVVLPCEECGTELKEANMEAVIEVDHECEGKELGVDEEPFDIDSVDASFMERLEDTTKTGKKIKNMRYMKKFYGADITASIKCNKCNEVFEMSEQVEEQASSFEDL